MSGGVDSTLAALLLKEQGYEVTGVFMRSSATVSPSGTGAAAGCPAEQEARRAAEHLGIELQVVDVSRDFLRLIETFVSEYGAGRTPNPCPVCNREVKFGVLMDHAASLGASVMATGHYARIERRDGETALLRAAHRDKDQSYALFAIPRDRLDRITFPLGEWSKDRVRGLAREHRLRAVDRPESQDICFVSGDYLDLVRERRPELLRPGPIVDETGREVGRHEGIAAFTIGQRRGIRVAFGEPRYVTTLDPVSATVTVGPASHLLASGLRVRDVNWLTAAVPDELRNVRVQIRYRHRPAPARLRRDGDEILVTFDRPQRAVTPGQAAVFYREDRVLGGGWIAGALGREAMEP